MQSPLLIIHGMDDAIVPFDMGLALFEKAPDPKWFVALAAAGHNEIGIADTPRYREAVENFIAALRQTEDRLG